MQPFIDEAFVPARAEGRHEEREAYAFDALTRLADTAARPAAATTGKRPSVRTLMLIRVDLEALKRGAIAGDELCEMPGVGPVPVSAARELLGESMLELVITNAVDVLNVTHLGRGPTRAQKLALLFRQPLCSVTGCYRQRCEVDHREDWAQSRHTRVDECDPLCKPHHDLKTYQHWALVGGTGKRPMVGPDDPRHPKYKPPP